jgi:cbb3-type cytochrome oxidase maturation protein
MTIAAYTLLFGVIVVLSATAIWGLWWAVRGGQYSSFQRGATSIFDEDEPIGQRTDAFPDQASMGARANGRRHTRMDHGAD